MIYYLVLKYIDYILLMCIKADIYLILYILSYDLNINYLQLFL